MIPAEYILKKLDRVDNEEYWNSVLPQLRTLLKGVRFDKNSTRHIEVGKSVSEWEVKYAVRNPEDASRALWIRRQFHGKYVDKDYCDTTVDPELQSLHNDLLEWMDVNIGSIRKKCYEGIISYEAMIQAEEKKKSVAFQRYVDQWEEEITVLLLKELKKIIRLRGQWEAHGCGLGLNGQVAAEFLHHAKVAHNLCREFAGREELVHRFLEIIRQPNKVHKDKRTATIQAVMNTSADTTLVANYGALSLVLYGEPGSGKSAFIAKLADEIYQHEIRGDFHPHPHQRRKSRDTSNHTMGGPSPTLLRKSSRAPRRPRPVLFRFCGTSENSLRSRSLIRSLRLQIQYLLGPTHTRFSKPPSDWEIFNDLLKHHAVIILLDGVNTLEGGYEFLSHLTLHRDTRIIISISSASSTSDSSSSSAAASSSIHNHRAALESFRADDVMCVEVTQPSNDIRSIMQAVLLQKNRVLTSSQWDIVMTRAAVEPSAIYLSMAIKIVEHWQSTQESPQLAPSLRGVVDQILDHVEVECGRTLCRLALGLITYSVRGVNDNGLFAFLLSFSLCLSLLLLSFHSLSLCLCLSLCLSFHHSC
jgi:hypothetical protein